MEPGDADVDDELGRASEPARGQLGLSGDRAVRGAGGQDGDEAAGLRRRFRRPGEQPSLGSWNASGSTECTASACSGAARVKSTAPEVSPESTASRSRPAIAATCSGVLPAQ